MSDPFFDEMLKRQDAQVREHFEQPKGIASGCGCVLVNGEIIQECEYHERLREALSDMESYVIGCARMLPDVEGESNLLAVKIERMKKQILLLEANCDRAQGEMHALNSLLQTIRTKLEDIVCTVKPDDGVVLLSDEGPTTYDPVHKIQVYDHEHFSPLGDALIELYELAGGVIREEPGKDE